MKRQAACIASTLAVISIGCSEPYATAPMSQHQDVNQAASNDVGQLTDTHIDTTEDTGSSLDISETVSLDIPSPPLDGTTTDIATNIEDIVDDSSSEVDTISPSEDTTSPVEDIVTPLEDTTVPVEDTPSPVEDIMVPVEDTFTSQDISDSPDTWIPACLSYDSLEEEFAPIQLTAGGTPDGASLLSWIEPTDFTYIAPFAGIPGQSASHEGVDYVHDNPSVLNLDVNAAANGTVVYVRTGCPQSSVFQSNTALRECGSGWGNHVIVEHTPGLFTRYAHLAPETVTSQVGQSVASGQFVGEMGNSGRSDVRHLHFELGVRTSAFDPCAPAQSLDAVFDAALLGL